MINPLTTFIRTCPTPVYTEMNKDDHHFAQIYNNRKQQQQK